MPQDPKLLYAEFVLDRIVARIDTRIVARMVARIVARNILLLVQKRQHIGPNSESAGRTNSVHDFVRISVPIEEISVPDSVRAFVLGASGAELL